MEPPRLEPERDRPQYSFGATLALVTGMVVVVVGFCVSSALIGGVGLDRLLGTKPIFTIALIVAAGPVSLYLVYRFASGALSRMAPPLPTRPGKMKRYNDEGGNEE
jgi:hypothetical protein